MGRVAPNNFLLCSNFWQKSVRL